MSTDKAATPLRKVDNTVGKSSSPSFSARSSPTTRVARTPKGASTSEDNFSPNNRCPGSQVCRSPASPTVPLLGSPVTTRVPAVTPRVREESSQVQDLQQQQQPSTDGKAEKPVKPLAARAAGSPSAPPPSVRPKYGADSRGQKNGQQTAAGSKRRSSKPQGKAAPQSKHKTSRNASSPGEKEKAEVAVSTESKELLEVKSTDTSDSASSSRSSSPGQKKRKASSAGGASNGKSKKPAVKVPDMDAENKTLSQLNASVNTLFQEQLRVLLASLKLDNRGIKEVLRKRVKNFYRSKAIEKGELKIARPESPLDYYCVMDVETTCEENSPKEDVHEPIELPVAVINSKTKEVDFRFHAYCRPALQPTLSTFCTELTGISQETVDEAETFDVVLSKLRQWLEEKLAGKSYSFVTDGDADIRNILAPACQRAGVEVPAFWQSWINIRNSLANFYRLNMTRMDLPGSPLTASKEKSEKPVPPQTKIRGMLHTLGLKHEGRDHSGRDDTENIARILQVMLRDNSCPRANKSLDSQGLSGSSSPAESGKVESPQQENGQSPCCEQGQGKSDLKPKDAESPTPTLESTEDLAATEATNAEAPVRDTSPWPSPEQVPANENRTVAVASPDDQTASFEDRRGAQTPAVDSSVPVDSVEPESPLVSSDIPSPSKPESVPCPESPILDDSSPTATNPVTSRSTEDSPSSSLSVTTMGQDKSVAVDSGIEDSATPDVGSVSPCSPSDISPAMANDITKSTVCQAAPSDGAEKTALETGSVHSACAGTEPEADESGNAALPLHSEHDSSLEDSWVVISSDTDCPTSSIEAQSEVAAADATQTTLEPGNGPALLANGTAPADVAAIASSASDESGAVMSPAASPASSTEAQPECTADGVAQCCTELCAGSSPQHGEGEEESSSTVIESESLAAECECSLADQVQDGTVDSTCNESPTDFLLLETMPSSCGSRRDSVSIAALIPESRVITVDDRRVIETAI